MHSTDSPQAPALRLVGLTKNFGANRVLKGVELDLVPGTVTALLGANGAGKSTLIKILAGVHAPTGGELLLSGEPTDFESPMAAARAGVRTVHQRIDDAIVPGLSVAENLLFEEIALKEVRSIASLRSLLPRAREIAATLDLDWDDAFLRQDVHELGIADCQMLLLARALSTTPQVLILDEPTSTLSQNEAERLFALVTKLRDRGVAILYVSHRLSEINALADRLAVLRDGRIVNAQRLPFDLQAAVAAMLGEGVLADAAELEELRGETTALALRGIRVLPESAPIDLDIQAGEVTGIIGLIGAGKTELAETVFGARKLGHGSMQLDARPFAPRDPKQAITRGVYLVPEDRAAQGMLPGWSVMRTLSLPFLADFVRGGILKPGRERDAGASAIDRFSVVTTGPEQSLDALSGGNQQKVMVARWMQRSPRVLLLDEPFRGVDIGARRVISQRAREQAAEGSAVVMICSDVDEIREMADRIIVMVEGRITLDGRAADIRNEQIINSMTEVA
ncbi:sugar ABC transporter ATP-binding protein [Leucobacter luti]|uniref:Monosaccharide ABC transporter ATP-binding protein (CUT2 family) n=1 Tax=Leucobacter luti TaxID=340320 RepID=A0A4Q7TZ05_9MICO|nr:sugar ABC transporter ATP-binding protein [Leucobacter luti]MBL3698977.1 sugar ABC transporter ATP-binding protein [Leucobacter luti]RZT66355.1 monosaccharide ABC transporter ATP-binding protein (CUT2 family) [Leucobacter luti]